MAKTPEDRVQAIVRECEERGEPVTPEEMEGLLAIREPDQSITRAAQSIAGDWVNTDHFTAMIDAILNEKPEGAS